MNDEDFTVPHTALDTYEDQRIKRRNKPTHEVSGLTAHEQRRATSLRVQKVGNLKSTKKYDGRALKLKRPRANIAMRTFYEEVSLPDFKEALEMSQDPKLKMLLFAIGNPRLKMCSFAEICNRCNLTINDISTVWKNHQVYRGMLKMMNHMPQVMEDTAVDAKSKMVQCSQCAGIGKLLEVTVNKQENPICPTCHGDGKVRIIGDKDSRAFLFEAGGLKKGSPGTQVNVNVGSVPTMEQMVEDAEKALNIDFAEIKDDENVSGGESKPQEVGEEVGPDSGSADAGRTDPSEDADAPEEG
jgi:hypothetical protein